MLRELLHFGRETRFELCRNKRTESRFRGIISILYCSKQRKMQIIPLNLDSVLLLLHNSKLAYCKKQANLCKDPWAGILVVLGWSLALGSLLGLEDLICCEGEAARIVLHTKNGKVITNNRPNRSMYFRRQCGRVVRAWDLKSVGQGWNPVLTTSWGCSW